MERLDDTRYSRPVEPLTGPVFTRDEYGSEDEWERLPDSEVERPGEHWSQLGGCDVRETWAGLLLIGVVDAPRCQA